jgi:hypothetical protein
LRRVRRFCFASIVETEALSHGLWVALAACASIAAVVQTARLTWTQLLRSWTARTRAARATAGEVLAETLVQRAGYQILGRQVEGGWTVHADGEPLDVDLRADLIVSRKGRTYVAEVKTGRIAPKLDCAATRRQLLEYRVAYGVDGVLLVDAEEKRVIKVELGSLDVAADQARARATSSWLPVFAVGMFVGALLMFIGHH